MRKGWNLIRTSDEWDVYRRDFEESQGWQGKQVVWGSGPLKYPVMVASYTPTMFKVVSAFFYADEAVELLLSANYVLDHELRRVKAPAGQSPATPSSAKIEQVMGVLGSADSSDGVLDDPGPPGEPGVPGIPGPTDMWRMQTEFNRNMTANLLTIVQVLVDDMKYLKRGQYELRLAANLAHVDRIHAAQTEDARNEARRAAGDIGGIIQ